MFIIAEKINIFAKYVNFTNVFFKKGLEILLKLIAINKYIINLIKKQSFSKLIYNLQLRKFKSLKTYV